MPYLFFEQIAFQNSLPFFIVDVIIFHDDPDILFVMYITYIFIFCLFFHFFWKIQFFLT